jgi:hypothetical protein
MLYGRKVPDYEEGGTEEGEKRNAWKGMRKPICA